MDNPDSNTQPNPLDAAAQSALTKFYRIELDAHLVGCCVRELGEDLRETREEITAVEKRLAELPKRVATQPMGPPPHSEWANKNPRAAAQELSRAHQRTNDGLQASKDREIRETEKKLAALRLRLPIVQSLYDSYVQRRTANEVRESLRRHLVEIGVLRSSGS